MPNFDVTQFSVCKTRLLGYCCMYSKVRIFPQQVVTTVMSHKSQTIQTEKLGYFFGKLCLNEWHAEIMIAAYVFIQR